MNCWSATCLLRPRTPGCSGVAGELLVVPRRLTHTKDTNCSFAAKKQKSVQCKANLCAPFHSANTCKEKHMSCWWKISYAFESGVIFHLSDWAQIWLAAANRNLFGQHRKKNKCQISKLPPPQAGSGLFTSSSSTSRTPSSWFPQMIQFSWTLCGRPRWSIQDILEMQQNQEWKPTFSMFKTLFNEINDLLNWCVSTRFLRHVAFITCNLSEPRPKSSNFWQFGNMRSSILRSDRWVCWNKVDLFVDPTVSWSSDRWKIDNVIVKHCFQRRSPAHSPLSFKP